MKEVSLKDLSLNPMTMVSSDWWLITAGNRERGYNTMTASWGHLGSLWGRPGAGGHGLPTAIVFIRPQRYTKEFTDREDLFTLSVFPPERHEALAYLGSHSGRDGDKVAAAGLTPVFEDGTTYFSEAKLVFVCRKLYAAPITEEGFTDKEIADCNYPKKDFHTMYVGEIVKVLAEE